MLKYTVIAVSAWVAFTLQAALAQECPFTKASIGPEGATPAGGLQLVLENIVKDGMLFETLIKPNVDIPGTEVVAFSPDTNSYSGFLDDDVTLVLEHSLPLAQWGANSEYYLDDFHFHSPPIHTGEIFENSALELYFGVDVNKQVHFTFSRTNAFLTGSETIVIAFPIKANESASSLSTLLLNDEDTVFEHSSLLQALMISKQFHDSTNTGAMQGQEKEIVTTTAQVASVDELLAKPLNQCTRYFTYSKDGEQSNTDSVTYVVLDTVHGLTQSAIDELIEIQSTISGDLTETYEWKVCNIETTGQSDSAEEAGQCFATPSELFALRSTMDNKGPQIFQYDSYFGPCPPVGALKIGFSSIETMPGVQIAIIGQVENLAQFPVSLEGLLIPLEYELNFTFWNGTTLSTSDPLLSHKRDVMYAQMESTVLCGDCTSSQGWCVNDPALSYPATFGAACDSIEIYPSDHGILLKFKEVTLCAGCSLATSWNGGVLLNEQDWFPLATGPVFTGIPFCQAKEHQAIIGSDGLSDEEVLEHYLVMGPGAELEGQAHYESSVAPCEDSAGCLVVDASLILPVIMPTPENPQLSMDISIKIKNAGKQDVVLGGSVSDFSFVMPYSMIFSDVSAKTEFDKLQGACWFISLNGQSSKNLCDSIYLNFTSSEIKVTFPTGFRLCAGCTLGGIDNVPTYSVLHSDLLPLSQPPTIGDFTVLCPEPTNGSGSGISSADIGILIWIAIAAGGAIVLFICVFCCLKYRHRKVSQVSDLRRGSELRKLFEENKQRSGKARKDKTLQRISVLSSNGKPNSTSNKKGPKPSFRLEDETVDPESPAAPETPPVIELPYPLEYTGKDVSSQSLKGTPFRKSGSDRKSEEKLKKERKGKLEMWAERRKERKQKKQKDKILEAWTNPAFQSRPGQPQMES